MVRPPLSASNSTHPSMNPPTLPDPNRPPPPPSQLNIQHPSIPPDLSKFVEEPEENLEENQIQERSRELHQAGDKLAQISIKEGKDAEWKKQGSLKEQDKQGAERDRSFRSPADQHPSEEGVDLSAIMKSLQIAIPEDIEVGYQGEEIQKPEENSHFRLLMKVASSSGMPRNIPLKALNDAMSSAWGGKYWIIDQVQSAMYIAYFRSEDAMDFVLKRQPWSVDSDNLLLEWINPKEAEKNFEDYQFRFIYVPIIVYGVPERFRTPSLMRFVIESSAQPSDLHPPPEITMTARKDYPSICKNGYPKTSEGQSQILCVSKGLHSFLSELRQGKKNLRLLRFDVPLCPALPQ
ncbi:hypothetical protein ACQ4PT_010683 [Festuca glaucescens]